MAISERQLKDWAITGLRARIAEARQVLAELEAQEKELLGELNATPQNGHSRRLPLLDGHAVEGLTKREAARRALEAIGQPARIPEIADLLLKWGMGDDVDRRVFKNTIYNAMNRADDEFAKDGPLWRLTEWAREGVKG
jgi:hypothetical protein